jgi:vacuolar-type H+-ATPase subunit I/STV1
MSETSRSVAEKMKLEMLETLLKGINDKLQKAEVLNGGFDRLQKDMASLRGDVGEIRTEVYKVNSELIHMRAQNSDFKKQLEDYSEAIYHPDDGIYSRIRRTSDLEDLREQKIDKALEKIDAVQKTIDPIQKTDMDLKKIAGDDLRELSTIVKTRHNIDRIFWILVTAIIGGGAKVIWDLISAAGH